ncbi:RS15 protein, partial [Pomatorhinus ruficollis]|nr:RS15 protein [Pomatorhinus ruficollis]
LQAEVEQKKKRTFRKFTYRGVDLDQLLDMSYGIKCHFSFLPGIKSHLERHKCPCGSREGQSWGSPSGPTSGHHGRSPAGITQLCQAPASPGVGMGMGMGMGGGCPCAPRRCPQHGSLHLQPEMIGHYLGEFSITYKPVKHGRPGIGATHSSRFIPLK